MREHVLVGRPVGRHGLPVAIYNRHLARLQHKLSKLDVGSEEARTLFADEEHFLPSASKFLKAQIEDYADEDDRWKNARPYFDEIFHPNKCRVQFEIPRAGKSGRALRADAVYLTEVAGKQIPYVIIEVKKDFGTGGQPLLQAIHYQVELLQNIGEEVSCLLYHNARL